jgi:hypothetical protein
MHPLRQPGAFSGLRLLPGEALEASARQLVEQVADTLLDKPTHNLQWMLAVSPDLKVGPQGGELGS